MNGALLRRPLATLQGADPGDGLAPGYYRVLAENRWRIAKWEPSNRRWIESGGNARPARFYDEIGEKVA